MSKKLLQGKVAGSRLSMPVMAVFGTMIWLAAGLAKEGWWLQFACFGVAAYLTLLINNVHVLLRIYSRMVSCSFIGLTCCACFLFPSLPGAVTQLCMTAFLLIIFICYQDRQSPGITFYAFLLIGIASLTFVNILFLVPIIWLLTAIDIRSLSWRTGIASLIGLLTPYWFYAPWLLYHHELTSLTDHFRPLVDFGQSFDISQFTVSQQLTLYWIILLAVIGTIHFLHKSFHDKIRTRMFYYFMMWMNVAVMLLLLLQPQHYDILIRLMILLTAPLIAHFLALTTTKITNIAFIAIVATTFMITLYNLWSTSFPF